MGFVLVEDSGKGGGVVVVDFRWGDGGGYGSEWADDVVG